MSTMVGTLQRLTDMRDLDVKTAQARVEGLSQAVSFLNDVLDRETGVEETVGLSTVRSNGPSSAIDLSDEPDYGG